MKLSPRQGFTAMTLAFCLIAVSIPSAKAATVASSNSDADAVCTQTVDLITGVEVYRYDNNCVVIFKKVGITTWTVPAGVTKIATLIIAGGGGGGYDVSGGGGAGGLLYYGGENPKTPNGETLTVSSGNVSVSVGDGGSGATASMLTTAGANGSNSYITLPSAQTYTAIGGGGGNSRNRTSTAAHAACLPAAARQHLGIGDAVHPQALAAKRAGQRGCDQAGQRAGGDDHLRADL